MRRNNLLIAALVFIAIICALGIAKYLGPSKVNASVAESVINGAISTIKSKAINASNVDWDNAKVTAYRIFRNGEDVRSLDAALSSLAKALGDGHSSYFTNVALQQMASVSPSEEITLFDNQPAPVGIRSLKIKTYAVLNEEKVERDAELLKQEIIRAKNQNICGLLIDLRSNGGGNMWATLAGLAPLLGNGRLFSFENRNGVRTDVDIVGGNVTWAGKRMVSLKPESDVGNWSPNVAVVVGPNTASSGELIAIALRSWKKTTVIGEKTAGMTSANEVVILENGGGFALTTSRVLDHQFNLLTDGLTPDIGVDSGNESIVLTATKWLAQRCTLWKTED